MLSTDEYIKLYEAQTVVAFANPFQILIDPADTRSPIHALNQIPEIAD